MCLRPVKAAGIWKPVYGVRCMVKGVNWGVCDRVVKGDKRSQAARLLTKLRNK